MASPLDLDDLNYVHLVPYNGSGPTGGDSLTEDLNIWYEVGRGSIFSRTRLTPMDALLIWRLADW